MDVQGGTGGGRVVLISVCVCVCVDNSWVKKGT